MRARLIAALLAATAATPAFASDLTRTSDGFTYFNKPGATIATHDSDLRECRERVSHLSQPDTDPPVYAPGIAGAIGVAIAQGIKQAIRDHTGRMVNIENCMIVKGWRTVALDPEEGRAVSGLSQKAKSAKLSEWVGAAEPHGAVVRTFGNDADFTTTAMYSPARHSMSTALSTDSVGADPEKRPGEPQTAPPPGAWVPKEARPIRPLKADQIGAVPDGMALIVVNVAGSGPKSYTFERVGPNSETPAWVVDKKPAQFTAWQPGNAFARSGFVPGSTVVFAVPPGRWRLSAITDGLFAVSFCMGAPAFDVAAGEVVYAGSFDPSAPNVDPDLSLDPAKAMFPAVSGLADKVRAAVYTNGEEGVCNGAYLYSLELPHRPFAADYAMGSLAHPNTAMAAAPSATPPSAASAGAPPAVSAGAAPTVANPSAHPPAAAAASGQSPSGH